MQILVVGNGSHQEELKEKFGQDHTYLLAESAIEITKNLRDTDVVFDFVSSDGTLVNYAEFYNPVFLNSAFTALSYHIHKLDIDKRDKFFGFCGIPTFVDRSILEVTISSKQSEEHLSLICAQLETDFVCVADRAGLVTPRVICMIINEAYYTLEEGTASRADIDLAMKLGTNYPYGPFEWANRIGIRQVIKLLDAVYHDSNDERYSVCELLRSEATH